MLKSLIPNQYKTDLFTNKGFVSLRNLNEFQGYMFYSKTVLIQGLFHCSVINLRFVVAPQQQLVYIITMSAVCQQLFDLFFKIYLKTLCFQVRYRSQRNE